MATVTGYTAERMKEIEDQAIIDGSVIGDDLFLIRHDGSTINAGDVRGIQGPMGSSGDTAILIVTSSTRPSSPYDGLMIYETDTKRYYSWNGTAWVYRGGVILCTATTRPDAPFNGLSIYETDTKRQYTWNGFAWSGASGQMRCKVKRATTQSIPNATVTAIVWTTEEYDAGGIWSPDNPSYFTIPSGGFGLWRFIFNAQFAINSSGGRHLGINLIPIEGSNINLAASSSSGSATWFSGGSVVAETIVGSGDIVLASVYHTAGSALNIDVGYNVSFTAVRLSA